MRMQGLLEPGTIKKTGDVLMKFALGRQRNRTALDPFRLGSAVEREPSLRLVDSRVAYKEPDCIPQFSAER